MLADNPTPLDPPVRVWEIARRLGFSSTRIKKDFAFYNVPVKSASSNVPAVLAATYISNIERQYSE